MPVLHRPPKPFPIFCDIRSRQRSTFVGYHCLAKLVGTLGILVVCTSYHHVLSLDYLDVCLILSSSHPLTLQVFHSLDKMTSILIHLTPAVVTFTARHTPGSQWPTSDSVSWMELFGGGVALYMIWQTLYYLKVEVWSKEKVEDRGYDTSFRYLTTAKNGMGNLLRRFPKQYRVFGFMFLQLVYTCITMLPCLVMYNSRTLHFLWIIFLTIFSAWNGSSYMFSVFASRYQAQLEALEAQHQLQLQSEQK